MKTQALLTTRAPFEALFLLLLEDCMLLEGLFLLPLEGCMPAALFVLHSVCVCVSAAPTNLFLQLPKAVAPTVATPANFSRLGQANVLPNAGH